MTRPTRWEVGPLGREGVNRLGLHPCVGYFEKADGPCTYDPGWGSTPCLVCWTPLGGVEGSNVGGNIRTHSLIHATDDLSLFYRTHKSCAENHPDEIEGIDGSVMHGERGRWSDLISPEDASKEVGE